MQLLTSKKKREEENECKEASIRIGLCLVTVMHAVGSGTLLLDKVPLDQMLRFDTCFQDGWFYAFYLVQFVTVEVGIFTQKLQIHSRPGFLGKVRQDSAELQQARP